MPAAAPVAADQDVVLVVGGEPDLAAPLRAALEATGHRVAAAGDARAGMAAVRRDRPAAVLVAPGAEDIAGARLVIGVCRLGSGTPVALVGPELGWLAQRERVPFLAAPLDPERLRAAVDHLLGGPVTTRPVAPNGKGADAATPPPPNRGRPAAGR
jgi:DNA-binding response OmpR family regulator